MSKYLNTKNKNKLFVHLRHIAYDLGPVHLVQYFVTLVDQQICTTLIAVDHETVRVRTLLCGTFRVRNTG